MNPSQNPKEHAACYGELLEQHTQLLNNAHYAVTRPACWQGQAIDLELKLALAAPSRDVAMVWAGKAFDRRIGAIDAAFVDKGAVRRVLAMVADWSRRPVEAA